MSLSNNRKLLLFVLALIGIVLVMGWIITIVIQKSDRRISLSLQPEQDKVVEPILTPKQYISLLNENPDLYVEIRNEEKEEFIVSEFKNIISNRQPFSIRITDDKPEFSNSWDGQNIYSGYSIQFNDQGSYQIDLFVNLEEMQKYGWDNSSVAQELELNLYQALYEYKLGVRGGGTPSEQSASNLKLKQAQEFAISLVQNSNKKTEDMLFSVKIL